MSAEDKVEALARSRWARMVDTENLTVSRPEFLLGISIGYSIWSPAKWFVLQPVPSSLEDCFADPSESNPAIMVPSYRSDWRPDRYIGNEALQRFKTAAPIHQVSTKQNNIRAFRGHDVENAGYYLTWAVFLQMEVTGKKDSFGQAKMRDVFTTHEELPAGSDFHALQPAPLVHRGNRIFVRAIASSHIKVPASTSGTVSRPRLARRRPRK